jgi:hypothetical protein
MRITLEKGMNDKINDHQEKGVTRRTFLKAGVAAAGALAASTCDFTTKPDSKLPTSEFVKSAYAGEPGPYDSCRIVVFGSDSLRVDYAQTLRSQGALALTQLNPPICASCGGLSYTQPGWASIFSGMPSERIRCWKNRHYKDMPGNFHLIEKLAKAYEGRDFFPVWITGKDRNIAGYKWYKAFENKTPQKREKLRRKTPHHAVYELIVNNRHPGVYAGDYERDNDEVHTLATTALLEAVQHDNFLCFVHFHDPDHTGHYVVRNGIPNDYETYMDKALEVDTYIADLMNILPSNTNIIYCSDHGFGFTSQGDPQDEHACEPLGMCATNFPLTVTPYTSQLSIGRLIYRLAGGNPDYTDRGSGSIYRMYGEDLI